MMCERNKFSGIAIFLVTVPVLCIILGTAEAIGPFRRPPPPAPLPVVKVGNDIVSLKRNRDRGAQTVDIAPLLDLGEQNRRSGESHPPGLYILRRKTRPSSASRYLHGFNGYNSDAFGLSDGYLSAYQGNRRSYGDARASAAHYAPLLNSYKSKPLAWIALQKALQRQRLLKSQYYNSPYSGLGRGKPQSYDSVLPLLYQYKLQKMAAHKYYEKYLRTLQLLALATSNLAPTSPELSQYTESFQNSPYGSLLRNSTFVATNSVNGTNNGNSTGFTFQDQMMEASGRADHPHSAYAAVQDEISSFQREIEKQHRRLLEVFPPPQSEVPFGERTILMVRFPPVPEKKNKNEKIKLSTTLDFDGGITFGGPRWFSFGKPFDPFDHPWQHKRPNHGPTKLAYQVADKPSGYGVIISQNFVYRPSIRFTNTDPQLLAKNQGDILHGGSTIVAQLATALAEGNRITNSYYLSKNLLEDKKWVSPAKKPPFVIVHLDTYTKKKNESKALGLNDDVEANYANGTIIYPTHNNPNILASTKFEFHNAEEIDKIFDKPLAILGHGYGNGQVPVFPKGINEIRNFLRLMYKVHQGSHDTARVKVDDLRKLSDELEMPAFPDSKPLLHDQIQDRSVNWLHTSSVGIRSLSEDDDHFPYEKHPVVDVSKDYY